MRLLHSAFAFLFVGVLIGSCTIFDARGDCQKNPVWGCDGEAGGGESTGGATGTTDTGSTAHCAQRCELWGGQRCKSGDVCKSGFCVDDVCCDRACDGLCEACALAGAKGTCTPLAAGTIEAPAINGKSCGAGSGGCSDKPGHCRCDDGDKNGDETGVDCGGSCSTKCGIGSPCSTADADGCEKGFCVDGYCCDTACNDPCEAGGVAAHPGLCLSPAPGVPDDCTGGLVCSTAGTCAKDIGEDCSDDAKCASNLCVASSGKCGKCQNGVPCKPDQACIDGACFNKGGTGDLCQTNDGCWGGHCVDGVCCAIPCDGLCMACHSSYTNAPNGTCAPILLGYDPHDECSGPGNSFCSGTDAVNGASACGNP